MNDEMLDEADEESFPASDPPSQTIPAPDEEEAPQNKSSPEDEPAG